MSENAMFPPLKSEIANEKSLILILAAIQFTTILDFLIIMPLGPQYMRVLRITPGQFGMIVSAYAISAGISGLCSALFLDRMDRKRALLILYSGFVIGTLLCGLAPGYHSLIAARAIAGAFGGVVGALILAIVGDVVPEKRRGSAMGMIMSSFSVASICGVPIGMILATNYGWHLPFFALAFLSSFILIAVFPLVPALPGNLKTVEVAGSPGLLALLSPRQHQMAFLFMTFLTMTGFLIFPHLSNYMVMNVGLSENQLPLIYLCGGCCTVFSLNLIGRWSDKAGKPFVFKVISCFAIIPILTLTNLTRVPLSAALAVSTIFMIFMSGRMVPAMAMMTASVENRYRGAFMSINSAVQQFSSGIAAFISGQIMSLSSDGKIAGFHNVGLFSVAACFVCVYLTKFLSRKS